MTHSRWNAPKAHGEHTAYGNTTRREMPALLADCEPFEGHSMWAEWQMHCYRLDDKSMTGYGCSLHDHELVTDHATYNVYSYDQLIAQYDPVDGTLHLNEYQYSSKTSEHQGMAAAWTGRNHANRNGTFGVQYEVVWSHTN